MVTIKIISEEKTKKEYGLDTRAYITLMIKHSIRYGGIEVPKKVMLRVLYLALKGFECDKNHLCCFQRDSIYEYLKDKDINDPYIKQFMKETKEVHKK